MEKIKIIFRCSIGILFIVSGLLKAVDSQTFAALINSYGIWTGLAYISPVISGVEILLGLFLVLEIMPRATTLSVIVITILFTLAFAYAFFAKGIDDCGCMGHFIKIPPLVTFVRNIFIIAGCSWLLKSAGENESTIVVWKVWAVLLVGCLSFLVAGFTLAKPVIDKHNFHQGDQLNTKLFQFLDKSIFTGKSVIFIFSPSCGHCWNATENVKSIKNIPEFSNLIGMTFNDADISGYVTAMQPNFEILHYPTAALYDEVKEVPILLILENGRIEKIFKSNDIPCGKILQQMLLEDKGR